MTFARLRVALLIIWALVIAGGLYLYVARAEYVRGEIEALSLSSRVLAATAYVAMGCVRGFTLVPVTYLIPIGLPFLSPTLHLLLTMGGILVSSASIYYFSERLRIAEHFEAQHARQIERLRELLRRRALPIVIGWSVFPLVPTDLICYVCGSLGVSIRTMLLGVLVGEGIICAIYIYLGRQLVSFVW